MGISPKNGDSKKRISGTDSTVILGGFKPITLEAMAHLVPWFSDANGDIFHSYIAMLIN